MTLMPPTTDARDAQRPTTATVTGTPNAEYIRVWNEILVPKFTRFRRVLVGSYEPHSRHAFERHPPRVGERVLDVGCGFGEASLQMARLVGPSGAVLGIDCCDGFVDVGRREAAAAGLDHVRFDVADAQVHRFEPAFDVVFARFGTMFFQNPVAAMRNLRGALRPGGRLLMLVWRTLDDNPWMGVPKAIARKHLPPPPDQAPTCGPGPFSMADQGTTADILTAAGFADVAFERVDAPSLLGAGVDEAMDFALQLGPAGEIVRDAGEEGERLRPTIEADLRAALAPYCGAAGVVMPSSSWCVTALEPA